VDVVVPNNFRWWLGENVVSQLEQVSNPGRFPRAARPGHQTIETCFKRGVERHYAVFSEVERRKFIFKIVNGSRPFKHGLCQRERE
jgi:hypothetical protein